MMRSMNLLTRVSNYLFTLYSEILEYAKFLGMSLPEDNELLWIAVEGVTIDILMSVS